MSAGPEFARVAVALTSWPPTDGVLAWTVESPAEGVEALATRGLWPWSVGDDAAPRWWCERCQGCGWLPGWQHCGCVGEPEHEYGHTADPPTLATLVAVASLGAPTLLRAEELARVLVGRAPRVVWRAMSREVLREWVDGGAGRPVAEAPQTIPQAACVAAVRGGWDGPSPWWLREAPDDVAAAWPAVRDLAVIGVTPVALDGDRITLAVEAL